MNPSTEDRLQSATESALGRFVYRFVMPATFSLLVWLGLRAIGSLDASIDALKAQSEVSANTQAQIQGEVKAIRSQMDYQTRYQELIDKQQNEELERHARALRLK